MNSQQQTLLVASILAFALFANVSAPVFATGGLDDEEEEEAITELQNAIEEIQGTLGTIELNLTQGTNEIEANCPSTEEIVEEVVQNITTTPEPCPLVVVEEPAPPVIVEPNVTEPCPLLPPAVVEPNVTEPEVPECPLAVEQNITEQIEDIIENVTDNNNQPPICNVTQGIIPDIILPPEQNVTEPAPVICPVTGEPIIVPPPAVEQNVTEQPTYEDGQEIATIEFDVACGCFVLDKTPEEVTE